MRALYVGKHDADRAKGTGDRSLIRGEYVESACAADPIVGGGGVNAWWARALPWE